MVALYARVSTRKQTNENQMEKLTAFAAARRYDVFSQYEDIVSSRNKHRPDLDRMVNDAKHGKFERVIAVKIDRLGRSITHLTQLFDQMESYGISIEMTDQPIDTSTAVGKLMLNIMGSFAEFERELISERTKDGLDRAVNEGKKLGRSEKKLSDYHKHKIKVIIEENPDISYSALSRQIEGLSRNTLVKLARQEGLIE